MNSPQHPDTLESAFYGLEKTEYRHFTVIPRTPVIGGVIEGGDFENMTDDFAEDLRDALWKFGVLFGLGRNLSFDAMKNVSLIFGDRLEEHSFAPTLKEQGHPEVTVIERSKSDGENKLDVDFWHHDVSARAHPNIMSILQADVVPFGADTMWSSATAAYDLLPEGLKLLFENITVDHDTLYTVLRHNFGGGDITPEKIAMLQEKATHPAVIRHHATGAPCLFVANGYIKRVSGYDVDLSELVIKLANQLPIIPELQVRHRWSPGDFAIWDNFATCHYGVSGHIGAQHRRLYRTAAWSESVKPEPFIRPR
ncbi:TauD/TfdA family dioxygenase [Luminiphilus sp.]|jgi:taurine dioxygenase|nr:TauD/TfdA family dioxygenase [Luminiphilus sp.]MDC3320342.1 TauD/TfdA family dioxygenase [Luminiphilus sp.]